MSSILESMSKPKSEPFVSTETNPVVSVKPVTMPSFMSVDGGGEDDNDIFVNAMIYGASGLRKTSWAAAIAAEGFNVLYLDGDGQSSVLKQHQTAEAKSRIYRIPLIDKPGLPGVNNDESQAVFANFLMKMAEGIPFIWNTKTKTTTVVDNGDGDCIHWNPEKLFSKNTVLIIDSWTAFTESLKRRFYNARKVKPYDMMQKSSSDRKDLWDHYDWSGNQMITLASALKTIPCHKIVIAHEDTTNKTNAKGEVISTKFHVLGTSKPAAQKLTRYFSDTLHFTITGSNIFINTKRTETEEAQSRRLPENNYKLAELPVKKLFSAYDAVADSTVEPLSFSK